MILFIHTCFVYSQLQSLLDHETSFTEKSPATLQTLLNKSTAQIIYYPEFVNRKSIIFHLSNVKLYFFRDQIFVHLLIY